MAEPPHDETTLIAGDPSVELSSNRTSLSFERTRMSSDRTLMSTVRTSLSLISFGFTIYQVFSRASSLIPHADSAARNLGLALLILGVAMLIMGLVSHTLFDRELSRRRKRLYGIALLRHSIQYHATPTYVIALLLLAVGLTALASIAARMF